MNSIPSPTFSTRELLESEMPDDPIVFFAMWFDDAQRAEIADANAMTLATATPDGIPSARIVLLKSFDDQGFCFFTNYDSAKGKQLTSNPLAALLFFWQPFERQVRIAGRVERMSEAESDEYFRTRPVGSQIGAHASPQSQIIADRAYLEQRYLQIESEYKSLTLPRPKHWGGFRVIAHSIEFWQGRINRLHDRILYVKGNGGWKRERLAP